MNLLRLKFPERVLGFFALASVFDGELQASGLKFVFEFAAQKNLGCVLFCLKVKFDSPNSLRNINAKRLY